MHVCEPPCHIWRPIGIMSRIAKTAKTKWLQHRRIVSKPITLKINKVGHNDHLQSVSRGGKSTKIVRRHFVIRAHLVQFPNGPSPFGLCMDSFNNHINFIAIPHPCFIIHTCPHTPSKMIPNSTPLIISVSTPTCALSSPLPFNKLYSLPDPVHRITASPANPTPPTNQSHLLVPRSPLPKPHSHDEPLYALCVIFKRNIIK